MRPKIKKKNPNTEIMQILYHKLNYKLLFCITFYGEDYRRKFRKINYS